ncbi:TlpA family protein disulfide reductase [Arthrobacter crystallopoietes]|uniref:Thiol-disulfide isomerase or thioredoxin n=1 Tax=Crystallibacter crystallopoietes TaxID=37928 RepID=A0A1H1ELU8_9MICC|nr:TlpA disulfide reductase family protein [Arthrobacter crystallopoietes]AUI49855.1 thiol-disulfide isomerase [Arthrobacter crystallopoietes]SDQ89702.1 Thiol-disulfide isomerase or thioredoxin [Arthrobacter crystallopoietes]
MIVTAQTPQPFNRRSLLKLGAGLVFALPLAACTVEDSLAQQANAGDNKNYIAGDGSVTEYDAATRGEPVQLSGKLFDGTTVEAADFAGQVTVLNFWYAACAPCRLEAPDLQALSEEFADEAQFYGVNIRDERATAEAFERNFGVTYPSFQDKDGGILLAMTNYVPPQAVPTTLVLDKKGRVAARILGVADKGTLKALIRDTAAA